MLEDGGGANDSMHLVAFIQQEFSQVRSVLPRDAGDECSRHGQAVTFMRPSWWALSRAMSASTMILTNSLKVVFGCHFNSRFAFAASPISKSTSAGRKYRGSCLTYFCHFNPACPKASSRNSSTEWVCPVAIT